MSSDNAQANREKLAFIANQHRMRRLGNGGSHTLEERLVKFAEMGSVCFYCGEAKKLTVDHDLPVSRGGTDDIANILPACKSCNSSKGARTAEEFIALKEQRARRSASDDA